MKAECLIKRVESKGGAHFAELYRDEHGYAYRMTGGGGSFGQISEQDARVRFDATVIPMFQPDSNTTWKD